MRDQDSTPRDRSRSWKLRTRLALALIAVFLPISILIAVSHVEDLHDRRQSRVESFVTIDETIAAIVSGFINDLQSFSLSAAISIGDDNRPLDQANVGPYLVDLAESYGILRSVFITDVNGITIAGNNANTGFDLSQRDYIKALQAGAETVWSGAVSGSLSGQTTVVFGRTIRGTDGSVRGYLLIAFYPTALAERLPNDLPSDANISLIDSQGLVLYTSQPGEGGQPLNVADSPIFTAARDGQTVVINSETTPLLENKRYGAFVPVENTGWVVGFTRPASAVDAPLNSRLQRDLIIMAGLLLGGIACMLFLAGRLSRPLTTLANAASAIARGERPVVPVDTADADVAQLELAMESMSRAIVQREERLQAQARVLQTLDRVGDQLATELDFDKAVASISQAALEVTSAEQAALIQMPEGGKEPNISVAGASEFPLSLDHPLVQRTLSGQMVRMADLAGTPNLQLRPDDERGADVRSFIGIPITSRTGRQHGGLFLIHSQSNAFDETQERLAIGLARRASISIENASLYGEAREIQEELRRANVAKDEFIGVISHELRTPITTIYGGARLLQTRRKSLPEEATEEMITSIEEESERLYRLVENLLAIARTDLGYEFAKEIINVDAVIDQVVKQFTNRHPGRPVEVSIQEDVPAAVGEAAYLHQVINNLVSNADKYSPAGLTIEIEARATRTEVEVHVRDHGPGVPAEEMDQIFESFFRSQRTARQASGKGLGLTVCKRLMEAMSGRIWAGQREGGGLEVSVALPLAAELPEDEVAVEAPESAG